MQPQSLSVFLQSEAGSNNNREKTELCKHQSHEGIKIVGEIDENLISFFFDDKGLKISLLN